MAALGPKRLKGEPELLYRYRWVDTVGVVDDEPDSLIPLRQMLYESPAKFYSLYAEQQKRFDDVRAAARAVREKEPVVVEVESEVPLDACADLVTQMLDEWDRHKVK